MGFNSAFEGLNISHKIIRFENTSSYIVLQLR